MWVYDPSIPGWRNRLTGEISTTDPFADSSSSSGSSLGAMDLITRRERGSSISDRSFGGSSLSPSVERMMNTAYGGKAVSAMYMLLNPTRGEGTLPIPNFDPTVYDLSPDSVSSYGNGISAPIQPDVDKIQEEEVESIRNQWQSFLAEYERIIGDANDQQKANWQAAADWNERMYRDQWKMQAEGLREAGINPLMMAGALRSSSVPQMSAASVVAPSFPSNEFSATANTEIAGLYSLYATLQSLKSEERRAELARILGYAELSQKAADSILRFIGSLIPGRTYVQNFTQTVG